MGMNYTNYAQFLQKYFVGKVQKLTISEGTTCPVRDGRLSRGGCSFCNARSFVPTIAPHSDIVAQVERGKRFFAHKHSRQSAPIYLAYFQSGTNTYAPVDQMRSLIEVALSVDGVEGVVLATRPDCLSDEWLAYLKTLSEETFVMVELGVESIDDEVLQAVGRGHDVACSAQAIVKLKAIGIPICVHLILGLPGESADYPIRAAHWLNEQGVDVVKLHQLQVVRGSRMAEVFEKEPASIPLFTLDEYVQTVANFLEHLSPAIAIERFVSQSPAAELIAPRWGVKNDEVLRRIEAELSRRGSRQGISNGKKITSAILRYL